MSNAAQTNKQSNMAAFIDIVPLAINGQTGATQLLTRTQNVSMINHIRQANASEIASYPTANAVVFCNSFNYNQPTVVTVITATTVAALKTAIAA